MRIYVIKPHSDSVPSSASVEGNVKELRAGEGSLAQAPTGSVEIGTPEKTSHTAPQAPIPAPPTQSIEQMTQDCEVAEWKQRERESARDEWNKMLQEQAQRLGTTSAPASPARSNSTNGPLYKDSPSGGAFGTQPGSKQGKWAGGDGGGSAANKTYQVKS